MTESFSDSLDQLVAIVKKGQLLSKRHALRRLKSFYAHYFMQILSYFIYFRLQGSFLVFLVMSVSLVAFIIHLNAFYRYARLFSLKNVVRLSFGPGRKVLIAFLFVYLLGNNFGKL